MPEIPIEKKIFIPKISKLELNRVNPKDESSIQFQRVPENLLTNENMELIEQNINHIITILNAAIDCLSWK